MTVLAAFHVLLRRYSGQPDIVIGTPIAGRNHIHAESLIGFFVNTLPLRMTCSDNLSFRELPRGVRGTVISAYSQQDVPFDRLIEELRPERNPGRNPLFQVMLMVQNTGRMSDTLGGTAISPFPVQSQTAKFDLTLIVTEGAGGLRFTFDYRTDLFDAATIERMHSHFQQILGRVLSEPDVAVADVPLISPAEKRLLLTDWNATERDYPRSACINDLLAPVVRQHPSKIAVVCGSQQLSYAELHERSNRFANFLRKRGVGPDCLVGLFVSRSVDMVVALIGVLKAGGAYIPIDPSYPKDRIQFILDDAKISLLVTEQSLSELLPNLR
jgi:non-ribosomal peptide synthetase component F